MPETSTHITEDMLQKTIPYETCYRTNIGKQTISATAVDLWQELTPDFKHLRTPLFEIMGQTTVLKLSKILLLTSNTN